MVFKVRKSSFLLIVALVSVAFLLSSCSECKVAKDCPTKGKCSIVTCDDGKCSSQTKESCCGNGIEDKTEDGKPGNKCTCPADYGKCEGKAQMLVRNKDVDATYLEKTCAANECVYAVKDENVKDRVLTIEKELPYFSWDVYVKFKNPFTIGKDKVEVSFKLKDDKADIVYPIKITEIQLVDGQTLYGIKEGLTGTFTKVGDTYTTAIDVNYEPSQIEEQRQMAVRVDYTYKYNVKGPKLEDGNYSMLEKTERASTDAKLSEKVFFLYPAGVKDEKST